MYAICDTHTPHETHTRSGSHVQCFANTGMYKHMLTHLRVYMCIYKHYVYVYVHSFTCTHVYIHKYTYAHTDITTYVHTNTYKYAYKQTNLPTYLRIPIDLRMQIHIYIPNTCYK